MKKRSRLIFFSFLILWLAAWPAGYSSVGFASLNTPNSRATITDIADWKHPVKAVFQKYKIGLTKIILLNQKTYPVFYVKLPSDFGTGTKALYHKIFEETASANAYWNYQLIDEQRDLSLEVFCDRKGRNVQNVIVNGDTAYYHRLLSGKPDPNWDRVIQCLNRNVPEIAAYRKLILDASATQLQKVTFIIRLDGEPDPAGSDPYLRDFYMIYVGENHDDHMVRWNTFLVRKTLTEILVDDPLTGNAVSLKEWRKKKKEEAQ